MYKIFDTLSEYNHFTNDGTNLTSGVTYYVKENSSSHFQTNNIDGEMKKYEMKNNEDLIDLIEKDITIFNIPNGTTTIGGGIFLYCSGLTNIIIPNSVTSIGSSAFNGCEGLTSITIPDSVTSIGTTAFKDCSSLTSVTIEATNPPTLGKQAFDNNATGRKIYVPDESVEAYKAATNWSQYATDIKPISEYIEE